MSPELAEEVDLLPEFLRKRLNNCPQQGAGVHQWLFRCALNLHAHLSESEIVELLIEKAAGCGRPPERLQREVVTQVRNAFDYLWLPDWPDRWALRYQRVKAFSTLVRGSDK